MSREDRGLIAVVGGGIFGVTAAVKLAQSGYRVDLFESRPDILMAASGINQFRLHRGYHYPRSPETAQECRRTEASFIQEYAGAIVDDVTHYYAVARQGSLVSTSDYLAFCDRQRLDYAVEWPHFVRRDALALCVKVTERLIDPDALRVICRSKLAHPRIRVRLNTEATASMLEAYEVIVVSAYSMNNTVLAQLVGPAIEPPRQGGVGPSAVLHRTMGRDVAPHRGACDGATGLPEGLHEQIDYQFELCEKPVVRLPKAFQGHSLVVMDGPFFCVDPFGRTGLFVMGNVLHAIHHANIGEAPIVPERYRPFLNAGVIPRPPVTRFDQFIEVAAESVPELAHAEHVGSMFTVRTVLPYKDKTDERPTIVRSVNDRIMTIFSGKIGTCVEAANDVVSRVEQHVGLSRSGPPIFAGSRVS